MVGTEEYRKTLARAEKIALKTGYSLNTDTDRLEKVIGLMTMNKSACGKYFCPCKQSHPLDRENDVICPCPELSAEIDAEDSCFCKLYFS